MTAALAHIRRPPSLTDEVFRALEERIRGGAYEPGDRLPTEKQLSSFFGVSRTVVREAISRLKADGFVETRQGAGAFVAVEPGLLSFKLIQGGGAGEDDLKHIFELRLAVEVSAAELAADRRTDDDVRAMRTELENMAQALRAETDGSEADDRFHRAIAAATHNPYLRRFVEFLGHHFSDTRRPTWSASGRDAGKPEAAQREHESLFAAIVAGDARAARVAAENHLRQSARRTGLMEDSS